ncbi:hypothetical protein B5X24_HaOG208879 [Helicoverpa armigera]|nr:hypothetical protein B5X24_HaOG208879 [Helicoverpa armigera]
MALYVNTEIEMSIHSDSELMDIDVIPMSECDDDDETIMNEVEKEIPDREVLHDHEAYNTKHSYNIGETVLFTYNIALKKFLHKIVFFDSY